MVEAKEDFTECPKCGGELYVFEFEQYEDHSCTEKSCGNCDFEYIAVYNFSHAVDKKGLLLDEDGNSIQFPARISR